MCAKHFDGVGDGRVNIELARPAWAAIRDSRRADVLHGGDIEPIVSKYKPDAKASRPHAAGRSVEHPA